MIATQRVYRGKKSGFSTSVAGQRRKRRFPFMSLGAILALAVTLYWISRDSRAIEDFLPAKGNLRLRVEEALTQRAAFAASPLWPVLPARHELWELRESLREPLPVPEWLAKNLLNSELYWIADRDSDGGILVSRMTRAGTIAARCARFLPGVERDSAGGLGLSRVAEDEFYFAVRGRILIGGSSRRALIHALTLAPDERADAAEFLAVDVEDARLTGTLKLTAEETARYGVESIAFAVLSDERQLGLIARGRLVDDAAGFAGLLAEGSGGTVHAPYDAPLAVAVNVGAPLREVSIALGEYLGTGWPDEAQWETWETPPESGMPAIGEMLGSMGPEIHLTVHGVDVNEVMPAPELVLSAPGGAERLAAYMEAFPAPTPGPSIEAVHASYDPESGYLRMPAPGGDSLEPSAAVHGDRFVFSTSLNRLREIVTRPEADSEEPALSHIYLRVRPEACIDVIADTGRVLADNKLLEGYTAESFEEEVLDWRARFASIGEVEAALRAKEGVLTLDLKVRFSPGS